MKKSLLLFAATLLGFVASAAPTQVFEDGQFLFGVLDGDKVSLVGYADKTLPEALVIPSTATFSGKTYEVAELGYRAFGENSVSTTETFDKTWSQSAASIKSVVVPNTVVTIGQGAFNSCVALESVTFGSSVEVIGQGAFRYCEALKSAVLPNTVTTIEQGAFNGCTALETVTIGSSVESIEQRAFFDCAALTKIVSLATTPPVAVKNSFNGIAADAVAYVPANAAEAYKAAVGWDKITEVREMGTLTVSLSAAELALNTGSTATITANVAKEGDVEVAAEGWESSDKEVAEVNSDGKVTAKSQGSASVTYTVTDNFGRTYTATCEVAVNSVDGLHTVISDEAEGPAEYYNLLGKKVDAATLAPGIYICKQNNVTRKVIIR